MKMKHLLNNKRGESYVGTCVCIFLLAMTFVIILNLTISAAIARGQRKGAIHALESYTQTNAIEIYNNIKQHSDEMDSLSPDVYLEKLSVAQSLTLADGVYLAPERVDGEYRYKVSGVRMGYRIENTTKIYVTYTLHVPLRFLERIVWIDIPVSISTGLDAKFDELVKPGGGGEVLPQKSYRAYKVMEGYEYEEAFLVFYNSGKCEEYHSGMLIDSTFYSVHDNEIFVLDLIAEGEFSSFAFFTDEERYISFVDEDGNMVRFAECDPNFTLSDQIA